MSDKRLIVSGLMAGLAAAMTAKGSEEYVLKAAPRERDPWDSLYAVQTVNTGRTAEKAAIRAAKEQRKRERRQAKRNAL